MRKTFVIAAILGSALSSVATPATAREAQTTVHYGDLDLSRPDDSATLRHRINRALEAVCGSYASVQSDQTDQITECRARAKTLADAEYARVMNEAKTRRLAAR